MHSKLLRGTVKKINLGTGFWGIIGEDGKEYRPVNLPAAMQKEGYQFAAPVVAAKGEMSVFMWGEAVRLV